MKIIFEVVIKENVNFDNESIMFHSNEGSLTRSIKVYSEIFESSGYQIVVSENVDLGRHDLLDIHYWKLKLL